MTKIEKVLLEMQLRKARQKNHGNVVKSITEQLKAYKK